jgi:endonuclease YncB( thermonuclease family)
MWECATISHRLASLGIVLAFVSVWANSPFAQTITDGDTLKQGGVTYRLWGIDAPETKQICPDGWPAGSLATTRLQALTAGRSIVCQEKDRDRYGRTVAICRANGEDLGAIMVREGFAWAFTRYSVDYVDLQEEARAANRGVHAHDCQPAWEWRAKQRQPGPQ